MQKSIEITMWGKSLDYDYLAWIKDQAKRLGLKGITFFRNDGSIRVIAEGEENYLLFFIKKLKKGKYFISLFSPIENFCAKWGNCNNEFIDFSISENMD